VHSVRAETEAAVRIMCARHRAVEVLSSSRAAIAFLDAPNAAMSGRRLAERAADSAKGLQEVLVVLDRTSYCA